MSGGKDQPRPPRRRIPPLPPPHGRTSARRPGFFRYLLLSGVALLSITACRPPLRDGSPPAGILIEDRLQMSTGGGAGVAGDATRPARFTLVRAGVRRSGLLLVAPATMAAALKGLGGRMLFKCLVAPVYNIGDGTIFEIELLVAGKSRTVLRRRVDAGRKADDRQWIPVAVSIDIPESERASLVLRATGGEPGESGEPGVDLVGDWLVVAEPRLTVERSDR